MIVKKLSTKTTYTHLTIEVIPLGFEPKTHSLEGCCSNPTELRNHYLNSGAKVDIFMRMTKFLRQKTK